MPWFGRYGNGMKDGLVVKTQDWDSRILSSVANSVVNLLCDSGQPFKGLVNLHPLAWWWDQELPLH